MKGKEYLIYFLLLSFYPFLFTGCMSGKGTTTNTEGGKEMNVSGYWEAATGKDSTLHGLYYIKINQNGTELSGTVETVDQNNRTTGALNGTLSGDQITIKSVTPPFSFIGRYEVKNGERLIKGLTDYMSRTPMPMTFLEVLRVPCEESPLIHPDNPYLLEKVDPPAGTVLAPGAPTGSPVIFIHGMVANIHEWDSLLARLSSDFYNRHQVWRFQYRWETNLLDNGQVLYDSLRAKGIQTPLIIAHSMGGLVARSYIALGGKIEKLVTLGTPHLGSPLTAMDFIYCWADEPGVQDMRPGSAYLTNLQTNSNDLGSRSIYYTIAGEISGHIRIIPPGWAWKEDYYSPTVKEGYFVMNLLGEKSDGIVPLKSALFDGGNTVHPLPVQKWVDHIHLSNPNEAEGIFEYINSL